MSSSLPPNGPNTVRVKRKWNEAPVDSLYVQEDETKKRRLNDITNASFYYKRVSSSAPVSNRATPFPVTPNAPSTPQPRTPSANDSNANSPGLSTLARQIRAFHLSREAAALQQQAALGNSRKRNVAVFIEQREREKEGDEGERKLKRPNTQAVRNVSGAKPAVEASKQLQQVTTGAAPVENKQQPEAKPEQPAQQASTTSVSEDVQQDGKYQGVPQAFAELLEEEEAQEKPKLKFQPKAVPRYRDRHPSSSAQVTEAMDIDASSDDGEYVYDEYVREPIAPDSLPPSMDPANPGNVGFLIIPAEGDELWEQYLDDEAEDSPAFDTDDEDSNAEDYYGNDYPEEYDELDDEENVDREYRFGEDDSDMEYAGPDDLDDFGDRDNYHMSSDDDAMRDPFGTGEIGKPVAMSGRNRGW